MAPWPYSATDRWLSVRHTHTGANNLFFYIAFQTRRLFNMAADVDPIGSARRLTGRHYTCELVGPTATLGEGMKMDRILMVTFHLPYNHGSWSGFTWYFVYDLAYGVETRVPPHDCSCCVVVGIMGLVGLKTSAFEEGSRRLDKRQSITKTLNKGCLELAALAG